MSETLFGPCVELLEPRARICRLSSYEREAGTLIAGDRIFRVGKKIGSCLKGADELVFFIATIGDGPEKLAAKLMADGDYPEGYMADLLASAMTESLAEFVQEEVTLMAGEQGLKASNRYSPGYCGWKVEQQCHLFALFDQNSCGILLTDSFLMHPVKSVSGVIGLGKDLPFSRHSCEICDMKSCAYRRVRRD